MKRSRRASRALWKGASTALVAVVLGSTALIATESGTAHAIASGYTQSQVVTNQDVSMVCRAYGGSLSANTEADQILNYTVTAPDYVTPGETYTMKIRPSLSIFPNADTSTGVSATIVAIFNNLTKFAIPSGVKINSATLGPINGNIDANPDAGYYVAPADVPAGAKTNPPTVEFDPVTALPHSKLITIPGTAPAAKVDNATNTVRFGMLGTGSESADSGNTTYAGGSAVQGPTIFLNLTAPKNLAAGTLLKTKFAGQLPAGSFTGSQPGNFPAPNTITVDRTNFTSSDNTWTNPTYVNYVYTTALGGLIKINAKAACAPGFEVGTNGTTPPSYYTGPNAIPNGQSPPISTTTLTGIVSPQDNGHYVTDQVVTADYSCIGMAHYDGNPENCVGDLPLGATIDTSSPGNFTFTVSATDGSGTSTSTNSYDVAGNSPPVADAGTNQTGKVAGTVVTLDGSNSSDPNVGDSVTYSWTQTGGPAVTLTGASTANPTFTVPAVTSPSGNTFTFELTVTDTYNASSTDTVDVTSAASTPTVTVAKARLDGGTCSNFCIGDRISLTANITNPDGIAGSDYTYAWTQTGGRTTSLSSNTAQNPTYILPPSGVSPGNTAACTSGSTAVSATNANCPTYSVVVTKTNTNASSATAALAAYASTLATRPVANAGSPQTRGTNRLVTLDGSGSTQANGHTFTYAWTQTAGTSVTLSDATAQKPTFTTPGTPQTLTFSLITTDTNNGVVGNGTGGKVSTASTVNITVGADNVVADAGPDQPGKVAGNVITLTAAASTDPDGKPLSYTWQQLTGPSVTLSNANAVSPTFTAPAATTPAGYTMTFTVTATNGGSNPGDSNTDATPVTITVGASTPTVTVAKSRTSNGGTCTNFCIGDVVTLTANITNPDGTNPADYTYAWTQTGGRTTALSATNVANPTYILPPSGVNPGNAAVCTSGTGAVSATSANCPTYSVVVTKTNTNKSSTTAALAAYSSTLATRPVANAGATQNLKVGASVQLDGSASAQANGHPFTYAWTQTGGTSVTLSDATAQKPTFTAPSAASTLTFSLIITDTNNGVVGNGTGGKVSPAVTTTVNVSDYTSPVANSGTSQAVKTGATGVQLDASGSTQADGHTLSYSWTQTQGATVTLSSSTAQKPTFTAPNTADTLKFTVTVTDTQNPNPATRSNTSAAVTVTVNEYASPIASAGSNQTPFTGTSVQLDASGSSQADGHTLSYSWTQTAGTAVTLSSNTAQQPTFTAPFSGATLKFTVTVTDTQNPNPATRSTTSSEVTITVTDYASPVARAGDDQLVNVEDTVHLDGSTSSQADGHTLTYHWTQTGGTAVTLSNANSATPSFTAPSSASLITFLLTVTDASNPNAALRSSSDSILIDVRSYAAPTANAGTDQSNIDPNQLVQLNGSASVSNSPHALTYHWTQTAGTPVTLSSATAQKPTFNAPTGPESLTFKLVVNDSLFDSAPAFVNVDVNGIAGLDFSTHTTGLVLGEKPKSAFVINVVNNGTLTRTVSSTGLAVTIKVNGSTIPSSAYAVTSRSLAVKPENKAQFNLTWNHGASLHAGDIIQVKVCQNFLGDTDPGNNCGTVNDPQGAIKVFAWPRWYPKPFIIVSKAGTATLPVWLTNLSSFTVRPLRYTENFTVKVQVGSGPVQNATPPAGAPFALSTAKAGTKLATYTWTHGAIAKGSSVKVTACAVIPGNTAASPCYSYTVLST